MLINKNTTLEHVLFGLNYLIENEHELLVDKYMRKGNLVNIKNLYMFKPLEVQTPLSLQETQKLFQNYNESLPQKVKIIHSDNETNNKEETKFDSTYGNNVVLAFLSRSYHESVKNSDAYVLTQIGDSNKINLYCHRTRKFYWY